MLDSNTKYTENTNQVRIYISETTKHASFLHHSVVSLVFKLMALFNITFKFLKSTIH